MVLVSAGDANRWNINVDCSRGFGGQESIAASGPSGASRNGLLTPNRRTTWICEAKARGRIPQSVGEPTRGLARRPGGQASG